jgi:hypothetical protein
VSSARHWPRRILYGAILLLALHGAAWLGTLWLLEGELAVRRQELAAQGWQVALGGSRWTGWPLAARIDLHDVSLRSPDGRSGWHSAAVRFGIRITRPLWLVAEFAGPHTMTIAGIEVPVRTGRLAVAGRLLGVPVRAETTVLGLRAEGPGGVLAIETLDLRTSTDPRAAPGQVAATLSASATGIELPSPLLARSPHDFGPRIPALALEGSITAPLPAGPPTRDAAAAWHAANGRLKLDRLALRWGKLDVTGSAEFELDDRLQPAGGGTLSALGVPETADALAAAGAIPDGTARAVKALAALMAKPPRNEVELSLALTGRTVSLAHFPIARIPELHW